LNPFHSYFDTVKPPKIENIAEIMKSEDNNEQKLSLFIKSIRHKSEQQGIYWYYRFRHFINAQTIMTSIEVKIRENTGWKQKWQKALIMQYKINNDMTKDQVIEKEIRKKITKSKHKWQIEGNATFGMIRRRLGEYYNINPHHIEIWTPVTNSYSQKWDYGSKGRGKWHQSIEKLISKRTEYRQQCPLKFEIQTYDVTDYDLMSAWDDRNSYGSPRAKSKFPQRIKNLAMFNFEFVAPNGGGPGSEVSFMTISHCKDWTAEQLMTNILKEVVENPVFGYAFFANIIEYIRKYEMNKEQSQNMDDLSIIKMLKPNRFLICDENNATAPTVFYMADKYKMPDHFSQIKYTDFKIQFLAKNDPLVLQINENKSNDQNNEMEIDSNKKEEKTKAIWIYFKQKGYKKRKGEIRCVFYKEDSIKDIILRDVVPYLKLSQKSVSVSTSSLSSLSINDNDKKQNNDTIKKDDDEKSDEDLLFERIMETHSVKFLMPNQSRNDIPLNMLEKRGTLKDVQLDQICLVITMPLPKYKQSNSYNRALTING